MDLTRWLLWLTRWWRRPPSRTHIMIMVVVVALAATIYTIEHTVGWPEWAKVERIRTPVR